MDKETARLEAFSDGVFAIAITLLILEIRVPKLDPVSNATIGAALAALWPSFASFVFSFFVVLLMWMNHHELLRLVRGLDNPLMLCNGLVLLLVTFVPFPTALLAQYLGTPGSNAVAAFYCGTFVLIGLSFNALLASVAHNHRLLHSHLEKEAILKIRHTYQLGLAIYIVATLLCFWNAYAGLGLNVLMIGVWMSIRYQQKPDSKNV